MAACSPTPIETVFSRSVAWTTSSGITSPPVVTTVTWHSTSRTSSCVSIGNNLLAPPLINSTRTLTETERIRPTETPRPSAHGDDECGRSEDEWERTTRTIRETETVRPNRTSRPSDSSADIDDDSIQPPERLGHRKRLVHPPAEMALATATKPTRALVARQRWRGGDDDGDDDGDDEPSCSWVTSQTVVTSSRLSTSWSTWTTLASSSQVTSVPISTRYQKCSSSDVVAIMHVAASSFSTSATSSSGSASPVGVPPTTLTLQASPTPLDVLTITTATLPSTSPSSSSSGTNDASPLLDTDNSSTTSSRGVAVGAAVGGILGVLTLIVISVCALRKYRRKRHEERTAAVRSSWFYGGDARLSQYEQPCHEDDERSEKDTHLVGSRFSAASVTGTHAHAITSGSHRFSNAAVAFLANPIANLRQSGGRFPNLGSMSHTLRASFLPRATASWWAWTDAPDPSPAAGAGAAGENSIFPALRSAHPPQAQRPILRAHEPGTESVESQEGSVDWGHSYSSPTSSIEHGPQVIISSPSTASPASAFMPASTAGRPTEVDRPWPYNLHHPSTRNLTPRSNPSQAATPLPIAAHPPASSGTGTASPPDSTLLEFASYDLPRDPSDRASGSRESLATTQSATSHDRNTKDWYEKALWDRGSNTTMSRYGERITVYTTGEAEDHAYSGLERGLSTKSGVSGQRKSVARKEVRWDH